MAKNSQTKNTDAEMKEMGIEMDHHNARKQREEWCEWCGCAVPEEDFTKKFHAAGGILAGPYCSTRCWSDFLRTSDWHELSRQERRQWYYENER